MINDALRKPLSSDSLAKRSKKMSKRLMLNLVSVNLLKLFLPVLYYLKMAKAFDYLMRLIGDYYYSQGVRQALNEFNFKEI